MTWADGVFLAAAVVLVCAAVVVVSIALGSDERREDYRR